MCTVEQVEIAGKRAGSREGSRDDQFIVFRQVTGEASAWASLKCISIYLERVGGSGLGKVP